MVSRIEIPEYSFAKYALGQPNIHLGLTKLGNDDRIEFKGCFERSGKMNFWYLLVGIGFVGAGTYKMLSNSFTSGAIWIVIGVLFGLLARVNNNKKE